MLRSWVRAQENTRSPMPLEASAFIPVALSRTAVVPSQPAANTAEIRIQIQRANTTVIVNWPLQGVAGCAQWLREWLA
jgi:transposase